ncbi:MAG: divergent PAP2 family protein [Ruminococcaceae bacterium]|nr:divergent PAP2 family protein [Oscillospiraceae bacterium]
MDFILELALNYPLVSAGCGWVVAQILKSITGVFKVKKFTLTEFFFGTGGMPSSHTAAVCALLCACGLKFGVGSGEFAISFILAMIVIRDAMGMRRQVGEHAKALNMIFKEFAEAKNDPKLTQKAFGELAGHTPLQVFAGALVGAVVAFSMALIPAFGISLI